MSCYITVISPGAVATFIAWTVRALVIGFLCYGTLEIVGVIIIIIIIITHLVLLLFSCACWGDCYQQKPKAQSFQIRSGWNLARLFLERIRIYRRSRILDMTSYFLIHSTFVLAVICFVPLKNCYFFYLIILLHCRWHLVVTRLSWKSWWHQKATSFFVMLVQMPMVGLCLALCLVDSTCW